MTNFLTEVTSKILTKSTSEDLVINWDQTGLNILPVGQYTMEREGTARVQIAGMTNKRKFV